MRKLLSCSIIILIALGCKKKDKYRFEVGYYQISTTYVYGTDSTVTKTSNQFIGPKKTGNDCEFEIYDSGILYKISLEENYTELELINYYLNGVGFLSAHCKMHVIDANKNYMSLSFDTTATTFQSFSNGTMTIKRIDQ